MSELKRDQWVDITIRHALFEGETPATPEDARVIVFGHDAIADAVHLAVTDDITITPSARVRDARSWLRPLTDPIAEMFKPGTPVVHLNPQLADWRGVVESDPENRRFLKTNDQSMFPGADPCSTTVRIRWEHTSLVGWYGISAVAPAPQEHRPTLVYFDADRISMPAEVCWTCSDEASGQWVPVTQCPQAAAQMGEQGSDHGDCRVVVRDEQDGGADHG